MQNGIQIGKVAARTGLSVDAIRFYEKQKLLQHPPRTEGGFRLFNGQDIERLRFIQRVQQLGFSLPEIRELLVLENDQGEACSHVRDLLRAKVRRVRDKIHELGTLERHLTRSLRQCERNLKSEKKCQREACPLLKEASNGAVDAN